MIDFQIIISPLNLSAMKTFNSIVIALLTLTMTTKAQMNDDVVVSVAKGININLKSDVALYEKTHVSVSHEKYQNKLMKMIISEAYKPILKMCAEKEFTGFLAYKGNDLVELKSANEILSLLKSIRENVPMFLSLLPETVTEEFFLNDIQRLEVWKYTDNQGKSRSLSVCYINDQILCISFLK
jgi:hypothetical protein